MNSGRVTSTIDALGYSTAYGYDALGRQVSVTDPLTNTVTTAYDAEGRVIAQRGATYPIDYAYDEFGDKIAMTTYRSGGPGFVPAASATSGGPGFVPAASAASGGPGFVPAASATSGGPGFVPAASAASGGPGFVPAAGDTTTWLRDEATGLVTNKVYADGKGPTYTYTPEGKLATRTWARGIVTTYSYDNNGVLTNTVYSDGTPTISLAYNRARRQIQAIDAAGVTTFLYDDFGAVTNETVVGVAGTNTIERFYDTFGRNAGYALNGIRQSTLAYDHATGRLATMQVPSEQSNNPNNQTIKQFSWSYLAGSDLKSSLAYPNGLTASWQYDANGLLLQVCNATATNTISQYDYVYDAAGRRINVSKSGTAFDHDDSIAYGYNARSELTNAVAAVDSDYRYAYDFDDVGNRESASERGTNSVYTANNLNQYTAVDDFTPQFDDDGNQTLIKTSTGIWSVTYNGENRPTLWSCIQTNNSNNPNNQTILSMSYDRMGRRVTKSTQRFVYDGYLQIANFEHSTSNLELQTFVWDPSEPVATRPLVWNSSTFQPFNFPTSYYTHDGNKNVSEVVAANGVITAHYEYAPFGAVLGMHGESASLNPWRFSSEYADNLQGLVYYNYRHYEPVAGRWLSRDLIEDIAGKHISILGSNRLGGLELYGYISQDDSNRFGSEVELLNLYCFVLNRQTSLFDLLGRNIYIKRRWSHKAICIDRWKVKDKFKECPDCRKKERFEKQGLFCIEFAWVNGILDINFGSDTWLKWNSRVFPTGVQLTGMVIEDVDSENGGTVVSQKETTVCQDWGYYNYGRRIKISFSPLARMRTKF